MKAGYPSVDDPPDHWMREDVCRSRVVGRPGRMPLWGERPDWGKLPEVNQKVDSSTCSASGRDMAITLGTRRRASYARTPDKESPLWDVHSQAIYWWTATEVNDREALIIVYDGQVWPRPKLVRWGYLGFRAVKDGWRK